MKRLWAVLLVISLSLSSFGGLTVKAAEAGTEVTVDSKTQEEKASAINVLTINDGEELLENYDNLNDVHIVYAKDEVFPELELDYVKEVLDNGTDFLVANAEVSTMEDIFETKVSIEEEEYKSAACYITSENAEYTVVPVYANVMYDEEEEVSDEKYQEDTEALYEYVTKDSDATITRNTVNADAITAEEVYEMVHDQSTEDVLTQITDDELAALQTSTLIGNSFCENSKVVYFYKEGTANGTGTDYAYSSNTTKTGWSKMGSLNMAVYGLKVKTIDTATFDNVYSVVTAAGVNDKYVKQFRVNVGVSELTSNKIIDETTLAGGSTSVSGKLATDVTASGTVGSGCVSTYAFNPGKQTVSTSFSDTYSKSWTFTPNSAKENGSWKVRPGILLKKTNGTTAAVTGNVNVDYFQVSGGVRTYTIKDTVKCSISFKNHSAV